jgi:probable F420-dependent oxidoreductase
VKFTLEYPSEAPTAGPEFLQPEVIRSVVSGAESAGFSAVAISEHPAPSLKWRRNGGHDTVDPIAALSFMAGFTSHLQLMTNLLVLPFRSPYVAAKSLTSLDILSGGRLIAGVGAGYLRSEFSAVGADFERRGALLDEALAALRSIWTDPETPVSGGDFAAVDTVYLNRPIQQPHPPIWIGGNGPAARRRVIQYASGWAPVIAPASVARSVRTHAIENAEQLGAAVIDLHQRLCDAGRDPASVDIQVNLPHCDFTDARSMRRTEAELAEFAANGATWAIVSIDTSSPQAATDSIDAFGENVINGTHAGVSP